MQYGTATFLSSLGMMETAFDRWHASVAACIAFSYVPASM